jgi:hypothetical protein
MVTIEATTRLPAYAIRKRIVGPPPPSRCSAIQRGIQLVLFDSLAENRLSASCADRISDCDSYGHTARNQRMPEGDSGFGLKAVWSMSSAVTDRRAHVDADTLQHVEV